MAKYSIDSTTLTGIGDAIRAKEGSSGTIPVTQIASRISAIETGGGNDVLHAVIDRTIKNIDSDASYIGPYAFSNCTKLEVASFSEASSVGMNAFDSCNQLREVYLPKSMSHASYAFYFCWRLKIADLHSATRLANNSFDGCYSLVSLIIRTNSVCVLANANAFTRCYHILGTVNATYNPNGEKDGYIYVPRALLSDTDATKDYRRATNWSTYATQFRALEDYTVDGTTTGALDETKI